VIFSHHILLPHYHYTLCDHNFDDFSKFPIYTTGFFLNFFFQITKPLYLTVNNNFFRKRAFIYLFVLPKMNDTSIYFFLKKTEIYSSFICLVLLYTLTMNNYLNECNLKSLITIRNLYFYIYNVM